MLILFELGLVPDEEILIPDSVDAAIPDEWTFDDDGGLSNGTKLGAVTDGFDGSGISVFDEEDEGKIQMFYFGNVVTPGVVVDSVSMRVRAQSDLRLFDARSELSAVWTVGAATAESSAQDIPGAVAVYTFTMYNPNGGGWTAEEVNMMAAGVRAARLKHCRMAVWKIEIVVAFHGGRRLVIPMDGMTPNPMG